MKKKHASIFLLLVFSLASINNGLVVQQFDNIRIKRQQQSFGRSYLEEGLASIKLTINHGIDCGAYHIDAKICRDDINICCQDEIVDNVNGFSRGDTIETKFNMNCDNFIISTIEENLSVKLTGRNGDGFCPANLEIQTAEGSRWKTSFSSGNSKIDETPKKALAFVDEGICPSNYQYAYDGGQKCCQHIYEDNEEYEYLQFNSHQCQNDISINCPFNEGCDDHQSYCQQEYVGVVVENFEQNNLNGLYEEAALVHNRPVYIQFVRENNVNKRKDNCIWWHLDSRRWQIGSCHDIGSKSKNYGAYFDEDVKCLPGAQTKDRWKQTSSNSYLSGRTEVTSGFHFETSRAPTFSGTIRKDFGNNEFRLRYSCRFQYKGDGFFNCE